MDADVHGPTPWLATSYVAGPSLADEVDAHGPLPPGAVLMLAAGLAEGLVAIHSAGLVHRDLKPSNVLLAEDGPRLIDFGISRAVDSSALTRTGMVMGSPGFMSPEQAQGREAGPPSDVFSLGAVLAFAATGREPFGSGSGEVLLGRVVSGEPDTDDLPAPDPAPGRALHDLRSAAAADRGSAPGRTEYRRVGRLARSRLWRRTAPAGTRPCSRTSPPRQRTPPPGERRRRGPPYRPGPPRCRSLPPDRSRAVFPCRRRALSLRRSSALSLRRGRALPLRRAGRLAGAAGWPSPWR